MSAAGSSGFACERIVPGHHPAPERSSLADSPARTFRQHMT